MCETLTSDGRAKLLATDCTSAKFGLFFSFHHQKCIKAHLSSSWMKKKYILKTVRVVQLQKLENSNYHFFPILTFTNFFFAAHTLNVSIQKYCARIGYYLKNVELKVDDFSQDLHQMQKCGKKSVLKRWSDCISTPINHELTLGWKFQLVIGGIYLCVACKTVVLL